MSGGSVITDLLSVFMPTLIEDIKDLTIKT
jgi:hypothetical protein